MLDWMWLVFRNRRDQVGSAPPRAALAGPAEDLSLIARRRARTLRQPSGSGE